MGFLYNNFLADIFGVMLKFLYENVVHNYFVVVLLVLILIKVLMTPLDLKQRESSAKMMKLQPKLDSIKKRYPDPMVQNQKIKELYTKENVKMMGGCLPSIVNLIVLIAFFGALQQLAYTEMVDIVVRAAQNPGEAIALESFLWVKNMWQPDSGNALVMPALADFEKILTIVSPDVAARVAGINYEAVIQPTLAAYSGYANGWYILPLLQGITTYFSMSYSMKANATPGVENPMGGPVMKIMMAAMTAWICLSVNTLFTVYFLFSNLLMVIQTFAFQKYFEYKDKKATEQKAVN